MYIRGNTCENLAGTLNKNKKNIKFESEGKKLSATYENERNNSYNNISPV